MLNSQSVFVSPISTTTTVGEANYNGGVGGAQYAKRVLCQATLPSLAPMNNSVFHYVYHQCISRTMNKQVRVTPIDSSFAADAIEAFAACDAGTNNRQIRLVFTNTSATRSTTAKTVFFALEID
ncbi:hypothetical protein F4827_004508 [Paraburkholderia bannensis]|uniref:Uncharacterized protein n=1 Tax=Paraburkholderia bannensis TaxID=765414 RepID=A0A7W9U0M1_9BURK|nr:MULTISPECIES: hypothetical protein [Paraburkholderia]MBB3259633.1 hypothetical protein [Paraburkholderia sp. WP4_3_2]MBB6104649.1 hypothetical protein [Paraburkholderia bannensis]